MYRKGSPTRAAVDPSRDGTRVHYTGRPAGDGLVRKLVLEAFKQSRGKALEAIRRRLENPKTVQDVLELLARLEGELARDATPGARGVRVIILNNRGDRPLDPETFRANALRRVVTESAEHPGSRGARDEV